MGKIADRMLNALGLVEYEEELVEETEELRSEVPQYNNVSSIPTSNYNRKPTPSTQRELNNSKVVNIHTNVQMEVVVTSPATFEEAKEICRHIKEKKPVVINLESIEYATAQRITDFVCGACYALDGNIQRVTANIYIIAPDNVDFAGDIDIKEELETNGIILPWKNA